MIAIDTAHSASPLVKKAMYQMVDRSFTLLKMRKIAYDYLAYHENTDLPFAALTVLHHDMLEGNNESIIEIAACVELITLAFNILDDWQDRDNINPPWMSEGSGQPLTIETGLFTLAMDILHQQSLSLKRKDFFQKITDLLALSIQGQFEDIHNQWINEKAYINVIQKKSGALTALACLAGALAAEHPFDLSMIETYSTTIGLCAQLQNDLEDVLDLNDKNDIFQRKRTIATMYLAEHPSRMGNKVALYFSHALSKDELLYEKRALVSWINASGVALYTKAIKAKYWIRAEKVLDHLSVSKKDKQLIRAFF